MVALSLLLPVPLPLLVPFPMPLPHKLYLRSPHVGHCVPLNTWSQSSLLSSFSDKVSPQTEQISAWSNVPPASDPSKVHKSSNVASLLLVLPAVDDPSALSSVP